MRSRTESNKIISDRRNKFELAAHRQSSETTEKSSVSKPKNIHVSKVRVVPRKAVSTPDLSLKNEKFWLPIGDQSKKLQCVVECSRNDSAKGEDSSPSIRRRRRRKRTAPKPPEAWPEVDKNPKSWKGSKTDLVKVPSILVDESKMASNITRSRNFDDRYLNPLPRHESNEYSKYSKFKPRSPVSKLRQFLSKSRELLTQWRSGEQTDDSHSTNSHSDYLAASSDDSYSTTSSRCNSTVL